MEARDKLLLDVIEDKQEKIFEKEGLAATDKGKKELKLLLVLVRREVENCGLHGLVELFIVSKNGSIFGGTFSTVDAVFSFIVDKKKTKKKMSIALERFEARRTATELNNMAGDCSWRS